MNSKQKLHHTWHCLVGLALGAMATLANAESLVLKRLSLSNSGVGYFEYEAVVNGNATLKLPVALEKVDDVLKSLVVQDAHGSVGGITLPGREPLSQILKQLPFDARFLKEPADLFDALRGAEISVTQPNLQGRIVSAQLIDASVSDKSAASRKKVQLGVLTAKGMRYFLLEDAGSVQFADSALRARIQAALEGMSNNQASESRTIEIVSLGKVARTVRVGFVTTVPIWKTAYRLVLPASASVASGTNSANAKAQLQGWAIVENMTGQDWSNVQITLTSGKPVSFSQKLYASYYNTRPEVAIDLPNQIVPNADRGTFAMPMPMPMMAARAMPAPAPAAAPMFNSFAPRVSAQTAPSSQLASASQASVAQTEQDTQMSYTFAKRVSVGNGRSLSVPLIEQAMTAQRIALWQPQTHAYSPLVSIEITNAGAAGLPAGAVTIYEPNGEGLDFVGDAQFAALPAGDKRYLSFAIDQKMTIEQSVNHKTDIKRYAISGSQLVAEQVQQQIYRFALKSKYPDARAVVLEVPQLAQPWRLVAGAYQLLGTSNGRYRLQVDTKKDSVGTAEIVQENATDARQNLINLSVPQLQTLSQHASMSLADKAVLDQIVKLHSIRNEWTKQKNTADQKLDSEQRNQNRLRENLKSVPESSQLQARYLRELEASENDYAKLGAEQKNAMQNEDAAARTLTEFVDKLPR